MPTMMRACAQQLEHSLSVPTTLCCCLAQNLLVNTMGHVLKLCDFGSAKILTPGEPNISYICSRCILLSAM